MSPPSNSSGQLGLSIVGVGTTYPPFSLKPDAIDTLANRFHNANGASMKKVLSINRFTGIDVGILPTRAVEMQPMADSFSSSLSHPSADAIIYW